MRSLEEVLTHPKKRKKFGFEHSSTYLLLKIPREERTPDVEAVLVERHQRLAYSAASALWKKYQNRLGASIDFDDVLAAAMHGLLIGVRRFDARFANEFSTYAMHWIRQVALREIENNMGMARIPIHFQSRLRNLDSRKGEADDKPARLVDYALMHYTSLNTFVSDADELIQFVSSGSSLNQPSCEGSELPETQLLRQDLRRRIEESIDTLMNEKSAGMVKMRFGLGGYGRPHTLEEVGKHFGVTRERIRQISEKYVEKAKNKRIFEADELAVFRRVS